MKVQNILSMQRIAGSYESKINKPSKADPAVKVNDKIEISESAKDFQVAMKAYKELPESRAEKVQAIKAQYQNGTYSVSGDEVADKMMASAKINKLG